MKIFIATLLLVSANLYGSGEQASHRADSHAPIGVMADHSHSANEWMISYRYMYMDMEGNRNGTTRQDTSEILRGEGNTGQYDISPTRMPMSMHNFGLMYAPYDQITLMAMVPYLDTSMDHATASGEQFSTESKGIGDIKLGAIFALNNTSERHTNLSLSVSIPTGSIDETDFLPSINSVGQMPLPMQLGSGTVDLIPRATSVLFFNKGSWGSQIQGVIRLEDNANNYRKGHEMKFSSWYAHNFNPQLSASLRLSYRNQGQYSNSDSAAAIPVSNAMGLTVPTADPKLRGGKSANIDIGFNSIVAHKHRFALELTKPFYQRLNGPQLETDLILTFGYQQAFK